MTDLFNPTEEHAALRGTLRNFVEHEVDPQAAAHDRSESFNHSDSSGSSASSASSASPCRRGSAAPAGRRRGRDRARGARRGPIPASTLAYLAHSMLFREQLLQNASDEQRAPPSARRLLRKESRRDVHERAVGRTDVLGMSTTAARRGDIYVLNGAKMWITNAPSAIPSSATSSSSTRGPATRARARSRSSSSRRARRAYRLGQKIKDKLGMRASTTAELVFDNCEVPAANLVGAEGDAVGHMMRNLEIERLTLAAMSLGIARRSIEIMNRYASERKSVRPAAPRVRSGSRAHRDVVRAVDGRPLLRLPNRGAPRPREGGGTASTPTASSSTARRWARKSPTARFRVLGGYGYVGEYQVERLWRDAKLLEIGGGTIEAHQKNLARDLAVSACCHELTDYRRPKSSSI